jgi:alpha-tubulin suppressor-like RCC1 family protein
MAGIKTDSTLWTWGNNPYGGLGLGDLTNRSSPVQVGTSSAWTQVSGGQYYMLGLQSPGTLYAWGLGNRGQLGNGGGNATTPVQISVTGQAVWQSLGTRGSYSNFGIQSNGTLWAWGWNSFGQLGLNTTTFAISSPAQIGTASNWIQVVGASSFTANMAIQSPGTLWVWGNNSYGQLGLNTINAGYSSPVQLGVVGGP